MCENKIECQKNSHFPHIFLFKMPDYLGKDQRKVKGDDDKDEKPFQGKYRA